MRFWFDIQFSWDVWLKRQLIKLFSNNVIQRVHLETAQNRKGFMILLLLPNSKREFVKITSVCCLYWAWLNDKSRYLNEWDLHFCSSSIRELFTKMKRDRTALTGNVCECIQVTEVRKTRGRRCLRLPATTFKQTSK